MHRVKIYMPPLHSQTNIPRRDSSVSSVIVISFMIYAQIMVPKTRFYLFPNLLLHKGNPLDRPIVPSRPTLQSRRSIWIFFVPRPCSHQIDLAGPVLCPG